MSNNFNDIMRKIKQQAIKTLQTEGAKVGKSKLTDKTNELVYEATQPKDYERTYELRDSISSENYQSDKVRIFFDTDKIHPYETDGWNQHMSQDGVDKSDLIPTYIENGTDGSLHDRDGAKMVEKTREELKDTKVIQNIIKEGLKKKGFKVK